VSETDQLITALRARAPRLALALAGSQAGWAAGRALWRRYQDRTSYTVKVPGNDEIYGDLHEWVLSRLSAGEQRGLIARTGRRGVRSSVDDFLPDEPDAELELRLRYDGARAQEFALGAHLIRVHVSEPADDVSGIRSRPPEIVFTASSLAGRDALLAAIADVLRVSQLSSRQPAFRVPGRHGWTRLDPLAPRELDSVVLPPGQLERLASDVARFLGAEPEYRRRGIGWHRGHLYEGPPGTGKTSVARAIASHFGMDVWYLPLADVKADGDLLRVASEINPRSMLLLEDVDVFHASTARNDHKTGVTLSGLLNTLDGIASPHGLLTVLTTNSPGALDAAVVRAGRVDLVEHFGLAGREQVARLLSRWYGTAAPSVSGITAVPPAAVIEACKRNATPAGALADLAAAAGKCA
jgi:hypothetical protein